MPIIMRPFEIKHSFIQMLLSFYGCNSPILNHIYLFNYLILMVFSHLFIAFNHLGGIKIFIWALTLQFGFYLFVYLLTKILGELMVGLNNYNLSDLIYFSVTSQKFKSELHKKIIVMERFISEPYSFCPNLKPNNFA